MERKPGYKVYAPGKGLQMQAGNHKLVGAKSLQAHRKRLLHRYLPVCLLWLFIAPIEFENGYIETTREPVIVEFGEIYIEHPVKIWKKATVRLSNLKVNPKEKQYADRRY